MRTNSRPDAAEIVKKVRARLKLRKDRDSNRVGGNGARSSVQQKQPGRETNEMKWLVQHSRALERYRGEWLLLQGGALVAHHRDFGVLQDAIAVRNISSPFVYYVPTKEESSFVPA
ncbi:MAG TPA: hypothetical protein VL523_02800 [Terriglobia bacterium]|nr:hypothetical protein [Terriglobia bacterium]